VQPDSGIASSKNSDVVSLNSLQTSASCGIQTKNSSPEYERQTEPSPSITPESEKRLNAIIAEYLKRKDSG
jgi:hypothetical protein